MIDQTCHHLYSDAGIVTVCTDNTGVTTISTGGTTTGGVIGKSNVTGGKTVYTAPSGASSCSSCNFISSLFTGNNLYITLGVVAVAAVILIFMYMRK